MHLPHPSKRLAPFITILLCCSWIQCSQAQTASAPVAPTTANALTSPAASAPAPSKQDALFYLDRVLAGQSSSLPLSLKVQDATVEEIVALVQKKLDVMKGVTAKPLRVEVRQVRPIRLSFDARNSTVEGVLKSAAILSEAKLWILPHLLLIAPETALTPEELGSSKKRAQFTMPDSTKTLTDQAIQAFTAFVKNDLAALSEGAVSPTVLPTSKEDEKWTSQVTLGELSPEAQEMVRQLTQYINDIVVTLPGPNPPKPMVLSSNAIVGTTSNPERGLLISIPPASKVGLPTGVLTLTGIGWSDDGEVDVDLTNGKKSSTTRVGPLFDPSAGKS